MQITQVPSSERFGEEFHDALRRFDEERKLLNARFASARHTGSKDYIVGKAYLRWEQFVVQPAGHRYKATLIARRVEGAADSLASPVEANVDLKRFLDPDQQAVFVGEIEMMQGVNGPIRALVWLGLPNQLGGDFPVTGLDDILDYRRLELRFRLPDREVSLLLIAAVRTGTSGYEVIERRTEVVNCVTGDGSESHWKGPSHPTR